MSRSLSLSLSISFPLSLSINTTCVEPRSTTGVSVQAVVVEEAEEEAGSDVSDSEDEGADTPQVTFICEILSFINLCSIKITIRLL